MKIVRKALVAETEAIGDARQVRVVCSTAAVDRAGDVVEQAGIDIANFARLKTVLWNHNQNAPIAKAVAVEIVGDHLEATVEFPPEGVSRLADEIHGLIKAGVINAVSIGFLPLDGTPIDGRNPKHGMRVTKAELLELSFVSVPANPNAEIMERAMPTQTKGAPRLVMKGLYELGELVTALQLLGWVSQNAAWEAEYEGDGSEIPEQLADACRQVGAILVEMTAEEVGEFLERVAPQAGDTAEKRMPHLVVKAAIAASDARRLPATTIKAGRVLSAKNLSSLVEACSAILGGHDAIKALVDEASGDDGSEDDAGSGDATKAAPPATTKNLDQERRRRRARLHAVA